VQFTFENTKLVISDEDMISDIQRVARERGLSELPIRLYHEHGAFSATAVKDRFSSWNKAVEVAGLTIGGERDIPDEQLFDNLRKVWIKLGRQPRAREMVPPISRYTRHPYKRRFHSWLAAMKAFVLSVEQSVGEVEIGPNIGAPGRSPRDPSLRLRFLVMRRDNFKCKYCGLSPATDPSIELHIDHVIAWAKGGQTILENLQTLCTRCNLGKSDLAENTG
jgi:hypothetical protein